VASPISSFDIRAERAEYERLFKHSARVLQDRLARLGGGDRTKELPVAECEELYQKEAYGRRLLHQARVFGLGQGKELLLCPQKILDINECDCLIASTIRGEARLAPTRLAGNHSNPETSAPTRPYYSIQTLPVIR
jgi:hypothetical protein